ncbi:GGDEF domain-containing protein [Pannonibacter tanglangensis]|uniref:diguanylate cyclase n=1 Tax=Pannonibacter tanglangensis TaxID=2750084 RepID=A0ABW9ZK66_9HYPH|nr:GGDEF domain-containing protein [Pannonibacter sp. XCT-34]NBN64453.1 diguanylate cyclase [Pannonibacter sp. XCT-34]
MAFSNSLLLVAQAALYFGVMMTLLHWRRSIGLGVFMCALGVMHFLETYLASVFYVQLPFGIISPGSTVLFTGKLLMILLLYVKEDAATVRQPIHGLLIGNFLIVGLVMLLRNHETVELAAGRAPDIGFVDEMGLLMVWGTVLLYIDSLAIILLYERLGRWLGRHFGLRVLICGAVVLTFDQLGFFLALHWVSGAPVEALVGGWIAKMLAVLLYTLFFLIYLALFPAAEPKGGPRRFRDVFQALTYRERYEDLLRSSHLDFLTKVSHRSQFDTTAKARLAEVLEAGQVASLLIIDIDHFKRVNDTYGHQAGDEVLATVARVLRDNQRSDDHVFRYGGEEFVILSLRMGAEAAQSFADRLRRQIEEVTRDAFLEAVTVSVGIASAPVEADSIDALFEAADRRLYVAKARGRNRVVGALNEAEPVVPAD